MVAKRNARKQPVLKRQRVPKTRNSATMTDAAFFGWLRSQLRRSSMRWRPIYQALNAARRPSQSANKRLRWEYQCAECSGWFARADVEVDHEPPVGSLRSYADLPGFVERLFCEVDGLRIKCNACHNRKTFAKE